MDNSGWSRLLHWWGGTVLAAMLAGAAFVLQAEAAESWPPWVGWSIKLGGAGATAVALLLPARQTWIEVRAREDAERLAKKAVANYQIALRSVLIPLTDIFDRIITAPDEASKMEAKGAAIQAVVSYVVKFTEISNNISQTRSCYFEYQCNNEEKKLVCHIYAGRDSRPRTTFDSTNPDHMEVFKLLENRQTEFRQNIDREDSLRFPAERRHNYKEYISVPVATSTEIFGLLTLDALGGDELGEQNQKEMLLIAQLLGIALACQA
jgi:transcriptional regulator with GAF, ATPase, and Fis domain